MNVHAFRIRSKTFNDLYILDQCYSMSVQLNAYHYLNHFRTLKRVSNVFTTRDDKENFYYLYTNSKQFNVIDKRYMSFEQFHTNVTSIAVIPIDQKCLKLNSNRLSN